MRKHAELSERDQRDALNAVNEGGAEIEECRKEAHSVDERLSALPLPDGAMMIIVALFLFAIGTLQFLVVSVTAEYLATSLFGTQSIIPKIARVIVPYFLVLVEATIALFRYRADPRFRGPAGPPTLYRQLTVFGFLWALIPLTMVMAIFLAGPPDAPRGVLTIAQGILAFCLTSLVLISGRWIDIAVESCRYFLGKRKSRGLHREITRCQTIMQGVITDAAGSLGITGSELIRRWWFRFSLAARKELAVLFEVDETNDDHRSDADDPDSENPRGPLAA